MTATHLSIDYDEGVPGSYRGVVLTGATAQRFMTNDPQADWEAYLAFARAHRLVVIERSSLTHFVFDNAEWRFSIGEDGREHLVPEERPDWADLMIEKQS